MPIKVPVSHFAETENPIVKLIWKQRPWIAKVILNKKNNAGSITIPDFITRQSHSNKNSMLQHKNRHKCRRNRTEGLEINPHNYNHLIFDKRAKNIHLRKDNLFLKWCWRNWLSTCRKLKLDPYSSLCTKVGLKDSNARS
jgi:hypothetical protein